MEERIILGWDLGFVLIPLSSGSKKPFIPGWQKWDMEKSKHYFEKRKSQNIGIVCGEKSNLMVVDVEKEGLEKWENFVNGRSLETMTIATGGGGRHYYFNYYPCRNSVKRKLPNGGSFDVRSEGGQVVWIGSIHPNGTIYQLLTEKENDEYPIMDVPKWIKDIL